MPDQTSREDHEDRLIDHALREKAGGQTPPDLSPEILADASDAATPRVERPSVTGAPSSRWAAVLTAALLFGGMMVALVSTGPQTPVAKHDGEMPSSPRDGQLLADYLEALELYEGVLAEASRVEIRTSVERGRTWNYNGQPDGGESIIVQEGAATELESGDFEGRQNYDTGVVILTDGSASMGIPDSGISGRGIVNTGGQTLPTSSYYRDYVQFFAPISEVEPSGDVVPRFSGDSVAWSGSDSVNGIPSRDMERQTPFATSVVPVIEGERDGDNMTRFVEHDNRRSQSGEARHESATYGVQGQGFGAADVDVLVKDSERSALQNELHRERVARAVGLTRVETESSFHSRRIAELRQEIASARSAIENAQEDRDEKLERVVNLTDELHRAEGQKRTLEERLASLERRISDAEVPAALNGRIVDQRRNFVELSIGADDGVRVGHVLDIHRERSYLGRIVVRRTSPDRAVGEIIPALRRGEIARGDQVRWSGLAIVEPDEQVQAEPDVDEPQVEEPAKEPKPEPKKTWRRAKAIPNASRLVIGDEDELLPEGVQMSVRIDGFRARVLMDLYYYNDRERQLEGNFKLRLPDEASLYYFAFGEMAYEYRPQEGDLASGFITPEFILATGSSPADIARLHDNSWENVKEARLVPRVKAAHAYSETVRRNIDPALVEWSGAGVFNARVFPLAPNKLHRIVVGYDVNLSHDGEDLLYQLEIPPDMAAAVIDINLAEAAVEQSVLTPSIPEHVRPLTAGGRTNFHYENPQQAISVRVKKPGTLLITGNDEATGKYFATEFASKLPAGENIAAKSTAIFLVDTSLSANPEKFNTQLALLRAILEENRADTKQFAVLLFNIEQHWWKESFTDNTPENVDTLIGYCETLSLEGATDLRAALAEATSPAWLALGGELALDYFLLSDGAATWGETNLHQLAKPLKSGLAGSLFAYKTGQTGTATGVLEHLARETGGAVFTVAKEEEVKQAATAHRQRPWQLLNVELAGGSDLLIAGRPRTIYPDQSLRLVGRGNPQADAEVKLTFERGDEKKTIKIPFAQKIESESAPRTYGQVAVGQLEDFMQATEDVAVSYARHFRVTGRTCSLLMLDSEEDYERFNIKTEEDPFVIKSSPAGELVAKTLAEIGNRLDDPKATLLHFLTQLEEFPGLEFKTPKSLAIALEKMPATAFEINPAALQCELRTREGIPADVLKGLGESELDYDLIVKESERRFDTHSAADALKVLSSLIENNPGDVVLARDVAFSAMEWELAGQAVPLLKRVALLRPYEPQTYQALGKSLTAMGKVDQAMIYYEILLASRWHDRYGEIRKVAAVEYSELLGRIAAGQLMTSVPDFAAARLETILKETDLVGSDLVITMMWNTDRTDVDLHVTEPSGEKCYYEHPNTESGGHLTSDVTQGFGPEMYFNKEAPVGKYQVYADFFGSDANRTTARTKVFVTVYRQFGTPEQQQTNHMIPLSRAKEHRHLTNVEIE